MNMNNFILVALMVSTFNANSATELVVDAGNLVGIDRLELFGNESTYNVSFVEGSFHSVFTNAGVIPVFEGSSSLANAAAAAIKNAIDAEGTFSNAPSQIHGCQNATNNCNILIPYSSESGYSSNIYSHTSNAYGGTLFSPDLDYSYITYAVITEVPLPTTAWLFLSALGGLGIIKRKRS